MKRIIPINKEPGYEWDVYGDGTYILILQEDLKSWLPKPTFDTQFFKVQDNVIIPKSETLKTSIKSNIEIDTELGDENAFFNKKGEFVSIQALNSHSGLAGKNAEAEFQHITQEQKASLHTHTNKASLDNYNPTLFATALQGEKADSALQALPSNTVIDADYTTLKDKVNGIEENANNYQHPLQHSTQILSGVSPIAGNPDKYLNERGDFKTPIISHSGVTNKNAEPSFQHVDTTTTKQTLAENDKVAIYDSVTGKVVLTNKSNVGSTNIISTNVTNNTGTIVIDTTPNWQRVNITSGIDTLVLDYENGVLPTKNREYLLVINNTHNYTKILTLPTDSIVKDGITYNFKNTAGSIPIEKNRSIEVNVVFFFIDATTCNIRTLITPF